ncbi:hypothetical protein HGRIS_013826 [Hohenbuehelia grisea]|uniref:DUF6697 domain-containing protein n=1 Tax=Hohenbuehelia grisea TaxID=104357 RepID=A0ABR3IWN9_9AGAR
MSVLNEQGLEFFLDSSLVAEISSVEDTVPHLATPLSTPNSTDATKTGPMLPSADSIRNLNGIPADPFRAADMAIELQVARMNAAEALYARDAAVRLLGAYNRQFKRLSGVEEDLNVHCSGEPIVSPPSHVAHIEEQRKLNEHIAKQDVIIKRLAEELKSTSMKLTAATKSQFGMVDPPPCYEDNGPAQALDARPPFARNETARISPTTLHVVPPFLPRSASQGALPTSSHPNTAADMQPKTPNIETNSENGVHVEPKISAADPLQRIKARNDILSALPLPTEGPHDDLEPIIIPAPFTLHEFLATSSGYLRNTLSNYRVLQELTTSWCPSSEEHGYFLTPVFKCSTNPRVVTAHRWSTVDVLNRLGKPTDCFYHKDGCWYYAGLYKAFRMDDLSVKEWEALSSEVRGI